jgi:predicted nucleic acid-binding protein
MILADTSIWVDYLRGRAPDMRPLIQTGRIVVHPFVTAEIALGSIHDRRKTLALMDMLIQVNVAHLDEVRRMVEAQSLYSKGIGLTDAHLIASCLITPGTQLWTGDVRLKRVAQFLGIQANLP